MNGRSMDNEQLAMCNGRHDILSTFKLYKLYELYKLSTVIPPHPERDSGTILASATVGNTVPIDRL